MELGQMYGGQQSQPAWNDNRRSAMKAANAGKLLGSIVVFLLIGSLIYLWSAGSFEGLSSSAGGNCDKIYEIDGYCQHGHTNFIPEQMHLSLGSKNGELYVTWSTIEKVNVTKLFYREICHGIRRRRSPDPKGGGRGSGSSSRSSSHGRGSSGPTSHGGFGAAGLGAGGIGAGGLGYGGYGARRPFMGGSPSLGWAYLGLASHNSYSRGHYGSHSRHGGEHPEMVEVGNLTTMDDQTPVEAKSKRVLYTYRARMKNLKPGHQYIYGVESTALAPSGIDCSTLKERKFHSKLYTFYVHNLDDHSRSVKVAMYGGLGLEYGLSTAPLIRDTDRSKFQLVIHNGDIAFDLGTDAGEFGDMFMREIEPIAARVPYQTSAGSREAGQNFSHYDHRFTMIKRGDNSGAPDERNNFFYSFNAGPVHFVAIATEFYFATTNSVAGGADKLRRQYEWLKRDLENASSPAQRFHRPWIVVFGNRPMYCSSSDYCSKESIVLRKGLPSTNEFPLEKMFYDHGVDLQFYSHEQMYERFLPLYDSKVLNGTESASDPYVNPRAPVHLISGSAGNYENLTSVVGQPVFGSVQQISADGYVIMTASRCRLELKRLSSDLDQKVLDSFNITKTRLTSFPIESSVNLSC